MTKQKSLVFLSVFESYALYLLTGAACVCLGSSLPSLIQHYGISLAKAAALVSAMAVGRVSTVFFSGMLTEKLGNRFSLTSGVVLLSLYLSFIPNTKNYFLAIVLSALAGVGQGLQDSVCPVILSNAFPNHYASAVSAGQAFFAAGCFLPPLIMSFLLATGNSWKIMYYCFVVLAVIMLILSPFVKTAAPAVKMNKEPARKKQLSKSRFLIFLLFGIITFGYCAVTNTFHTYTSSYLMSFGIKESVSVSVLTLFSVGGMAGAIVFIAILKKLHTTTVLWMNTSIGLVCVIIAILLKSELAFFICFSITGFFYGVLFSVLVTLSTELMPDHTGIAAALVGFIGGSADIMSPLITGAFVNSFGVSSTFLYILVMAAVTAGTAIVLRFIFVRKTRQGSLRASCQ